MRKLKSIWCSSPMTCRNLQAWLMFLLCLRFQKTKFGLVCLVVQTVGFQRQEGRRKAPRAGGNDGGSRTCYI